MRLVLAEVFIGQNYPRAIKENSIAKFIILPPGTLSKSILLTPALQMDFLMGFH